jgi:hypothetical protein
LNKPIEKYLFTVPKPALTKAQPVYLIVTGIMPIET